MPRLLEVKALECAALAALLALSGAGVTALFIQKMPGFVDTTASTSLANLAPSPELISQGHQFYDMSCSHCHGDDAHGDEGPDLHRLAISNARMASTIKKGIKGEMPTFAKKYDDRQIAALVAYLRSLP